MQIDVSDILSQGEGAQADFTISDEQPVLDDIKLASPVNGQLRLIGTQEGIVVSGELETDVTLECSRCLRAFDHHLDLRLIAEFDDHPDEEQFPIDKHGRIDLAEPLRQEIEVRMPLTPLCQADCGGIELNQTKEEQANGSS